MDFWGIYSEGGTFYIGVADGGSVPGLSSNDVGRINPLISNTAKSNNSRNKGSQCLLPPAHLTKSESPCKIFLRIDLVDVPGIF